jgi:hypothetical protein
VHGNSLFLFEILRSSCHRGGEGCRQRNHIKRGNITVAITSVDVSLILIYFLSLCFISYVIDYNISIYLLSDASFIYLLIHSFYYYLFSFTIFFFVQLDGAHPSIKAHTHIVQFNVNKNANLPFHLLSWGQHFVRKHNCESLFNDNHTAPDNVLLKICEKKGVATAKGTPVNVTYHRPSDVYLQQTSKSRTTTKKIERMIFENGRTQTETKGENINVPFKYIYYTESDQILRYGSPTAMEMLVSATNETTLLAGRRRNKDVMSNASEYMSGKSSICYSMLCFFDLVISSLRLLQICFTCSPNCFLIFNLIPYRFF